MTALDLRSLILDALTADPGSPSNGEFWYRDDLKIYRGRQAGLTINLMPALFATMFQTGDVTTSSTSFVDAFGGSSVAVPAAGDYLGIFECAMNGGAASRDIAFGKNSPTTLFGSSSRQCDGNNREPALSSALLTGLVTTDTIHGIFKKTSGGGDVTIGARRLSIIRLGK